jgi:uncharacterized protein (DUF1684 family)
MSALLVGSFFVLAAINAMQGESITSYSAELFKWRAEQTANLKRPEGFLSVAGLDWLVEGDNSVGSGPDCQVRLSATSCPPQLGTLKRIGGLVSLKLAEGVSIHVTKDSGEAIEIRGSRSQLPVTLRSDSTRVSVGKVTFMVITRGSRVGVRVFDSGCPGYLAFKGQKWFSPDQKYRVEAKFVPYEPVKTVEITNVLGDKSQASVVGYVEFTIDGKICRLDAQGAGGGLFLNFKDLTSGKSTYPAGRFLDTPAPVNGKVIVDFNKATNPPCAFTSFATCPLPPAGNVLAVEIPAGEKTHHPVH